MIGSMLTTASPMVTTSFTAGAPLQLLLAENDELTPPSRVQGYLAYLERTGTHAPIATVTYSGAYHAWTNPSIPKARYFPNHGSTRKCPLLLVGEVRLRILVDGEEKNFDPAGRQQCLDEGRGYTMGFSASIRARSLIDTIAFLRKPLLPSSRG